MGRITLSPFGQIIAGLALMGCLLCGCQCATEPPTTTDTVPKQEPVQAPALELERLPVEHLPNAIRIHPKVLSGGLPEDAAAFEELKQLGVRTIISVDGAKPDVELAKQFGMKYIHLPHGYSGVPKFRSLELAKAVLEKEGPIYIHCHHGKHRSPTAAAVACVGAGFIAAHEANSILKFASTSASYQGLYQSAELAQRYETKQLHELQVDYRESVEVPPLAESMVELDQVFERVANANRTGWKQALELANTTLPHDVLLLREQFTEMLRTDEVQRQPIAFQELTRSSEIAAQELEDLLGNLVAQIRVAQLGDDAARFQQMSEAFSRIEQNCKSCHQKFRDVPLVR